MNYMNELVFKKLLLIGNKCSLKLRIVKYGNIYDKTRKHKFDDRQ